MSLNRIKNNSFERIIKTGLSYWVKSKCTTIENIEIQLNGLDLQATSLKLETFSFKARNINFNNIVFKEVTLISTPLDIELNLLAKKKDLISIKNNFKVIGDLILTEQHLNIILSSVRWSGINSWLMTKFFNNHKLEKITLKSNKLLIQGLENSNQVTMTKAFDLNTEEGKLIINDCNSSSRAILPMDESVKIENIMIENDLLIVKIIAEVIY